MCDGIILPVVNEELNQIDSPPSLPEFESSPEEPVKDTSPQTDTISTVNQPKSNLNQAPESATSLQPSGQAPQNANSSLQTSGTLNNGSQNDASNVLNQGVVSDAPLSVGVASASTASSVAVAETPVATNQSYAAQVWLIFIFLAAAIIILFLSNKKRANEVIDSRPKETLELNEVEKISANEEQAKPKEKPKKKLKNGRRAR